MGKSPYLRNVAKVLQGNVIAQLIAIAAVPLLARLFSPDAFALAQTGIAVLSAAIVFSCLRYDFALTVCDDDEISSLLWVVAVTATLVSALIALALILAPVSLFQTLQLGVLKPFAGWFALSVLVAAFANVMSFLAIRVHAFSHLSVAKILQSSGFVLTALMIGLASPVMEGLLIADTIGRSLVLVFIAVVLARLAFTNQQNWGVSGAAVVSVIKRYKWFPLISLPGGLVNALAASFNTVWMLALFTATDAGSYALVERLVTAPIAFIGTALQQVYQGQFSFAVRNGGIGLRAGFVRLLVGLFLVGIIPTLALMLLAPTLLPLVLGAQWADAGRYCQVLAPSILATFVGVPFNMVLALLQRQRLQLFWELSKAALVTAAWLTSLRLGFSPLQALALVSLATAVSYIAFITIAYRAVCHLERDGAAPLPYPADPSEPGLKKPDMHDEL